MAFVRLATIDDAPGIARVHVDAWREAYKGLIDADSLAALDVDQRADGWRRWLGNDPALNQEQHTCIVAVDGSDAVAGWATYGTGRDPGWEHYGELAGFYAHPSAWSTGVGRAMAERVLSDLAAMGFKRSYLWVLRGNERAIRFYERAGWAADGGEKTVEFRTGGDLRELRFVRDLQRHS